MPTFIGTDQNDSIVPGYISPGVVADPAGTVPGDGADVIYGNAGADTLAGGGGNDTIEGGAGGDSISGGDGHDDLNSNAATGLGNDTIDGGAGVDNISGWAGDDSLFGGADGDYLKGMDGSDTLDGGAGSDDLFGGLGNDLLRGGAGDDDFYGNEGADTLIGGAGNDLYYLDGLDVIRERAGGGVDTVVAGVDITLGANVENLTMDAAAVGTGNSLDNTMSSEGGATLRGGLGDDVYEITEDRAVSIVEMAGEGFDTANITFEYDYGGGYSQEHYYLLPENIETLNVRDGYRENPYDGSYEYVGSEIVGNDADTVIHGGAGGNVIFGLGGSDTLFGNGSSDKLDGGEGSDYLDGGDDTDTVLYTSSATPVRVDLATGRATFPDQNGDVDTLMGFEKAETGSGDDILIGDSRANVFRGRGGNDVIKGGLGADELFGGTGNDTFDGGGGWDNIYGGAGSDTVLYTANTTSVNIDLGTWSASFPGQTWASEYVYGIENAATGSGADTLIGSSVANVLRGMAGDDVLEGGGAADRLVGGAGNDVFVFTADASTPAARDTIAAGDGRTAFQGAGAAAGDRIDVSGLDADSGTAGMQDWVFGTSAAKGHLWVTTSGTQTIVNGNADDDAAVEFQVAIADGALPASAYTADDFIL